MVVAIVICVAWMGQTHCVGTKAHAAADIRAFDLQLERYKCLNGNYPTSKQGLRLLGIPPQDPWGSDYCYRCPGKLHPDGYDLFSAGPDRRVDTSDDEWEASP